MLPTLAQKWDTNQAVLPPSLPPHVRMLAKGMFFAGAAALMEIQLAAAADNVSQEHAVAHMKVVTKEMHGWMNELIKGLS
jgi:hypothetical protein